MRIKFEKEGHKYISDAGDNYISVSGLIKKYEKQKNWDEIAKKYAKKHGLTITEVKEKWERKRDLSATAGTIYHSIREQELLDIIFEYDGFPCKMEECPYDGPTKYSLDITKLTNNTVYPELMIYDHKYRLCGQSDKVVVVRNTINVLDYKTDQELKTKAYSDKFTQPEKLEFPIQHLDNCNMVLYSLKMSLYMYMLWKANPHLKVGKLEIEHVQLKRDDEGIPILEDGKPVELTRTIVKVPYRKKEVIDILKHYGKTL